MHHSDPKQFGYYSIGNHHVFSKLEALELSTRLNAPVHYHYNDEAFSKITWSAEPELDLTTLYKIRAQQIRLKYDYVVLFYSGGADSHNMLEAFLHAGVEPDEIASLHAKNDKNNALNREIFETAIPYVQQLKAAGRLGANVQHRLINMQEVVDFFTKNINWDDFNYFSSSGLSIYGPSRGIIRKYIKEWAKIIESGKSLCLVWGYDKPRVNQVDDCFYLEFMDIQGGCISVSNQQYPQAGYFDEMFYHTPDMPEIAVKQAHVVKKFLESASADHPYLTIKPNKNVSVIKNKKKLYLSQDGLSITIYPWFNQSLYYEPRVKDFITSPRDLWYWSDPVLSKNFHKHTNNLIEVWGDKLVNVSSHGRYINSFFSKKYLIGQ